ncbi:MAG: response regulator, partial [Blastocatellia bacterium]
MAVTDGGPFDIEITESLENGLERLSRGGIDLILLGLAMFDSQSLDTFTEIHANFPLLPVIVLTANGNEEMAREALKA